jgi:hypothetical protein
MENYIKNTGAKICVTFNDPEKKAVISVEEPVLFTSE